MQTLKELFGHFQSRNESQNHSSNNDETAEVTPLLSQIENSVNVNGIERKSESGDDIVLENTVDHYLTGDNFGIVMKDLIAKSDISVHRWPVELSQMVGCYIGDAFAWRSIHFMECARISGEPMPETMQTRYISADTRIIDFFRKIASESNPKMNDSKVDPRDYIRLHMPLQSFVDSNLLPINTQGCALRQSHVNKVIRATNDDLDRWVEIPDDLVFFLKPKQLKGRLSFMIERRNDALQKKTRKASDPETSWSRYQMSRNDPPLNSRIGDIIDAKDVNGVWYQAFVRCISQFEDKSTKKPVQYLLVHYIGCCLKFDEWIAVSDETRFAKRGTKSSKVYRIGGSVMVCAYNLSDTYADEQKYTQQLATLRAMGFNCTDYHRNVLEMFNGNVEASVDNLRLNERSQKKTFLNLFR